MHDSGGGRGAASWAEIARPDANARPDALLVAVPLYRSPELIPDLFDALVAMADELAELSATVLLINDSPGDAGLDAALAAHLPRLHAAMPVNLVVNPSNLGFVRSANRALAMARDSSRDVILLNSDALPRPGAFAEMVAVAYHDPMVAAVSPRSDNATICNSPYAAECRPSDRDGAWAAHRAVAAHLPRFTFVPTVVGFCMLIRRLMLSEFGLFDEAYGGGYNEENDFVRRCNQRGYRAVLANHAYAHHLGNVSFAATATAPSAREAVNRATLDRRYPEYGRVIERYFESPEFHAQRLLGGLVPMADGRLRLLFDCRILKPFFNGTHEHLCALLRAVAGRHAARFDLGVLCDERAFRFHALNRVDGLRHVGEAELAEHPFAAAIRLGQPFSPADLAPLARMAPVVGALMLDTIAMDCQQLDEQDLEQLWQLLLDDVDVIGFNSAFSRDQFNRRFAVPSAIRQFVSLCSTEVSDYASPVVAPPGRGMLVVGNHYPHKHVADTVGAIRARDRDVPITVLGVPIDPALDVRCVTAGDLPQAEVDALYDDAALVLMPSHYEGFGLPILHGLARERAVVARDLPCAREIAAACPQAINLHLAASTEALVDIALARPAWRPVPRDARSPHDWGAAADAIADALEHALAGFRFETLRQRLARAASRRPSPIAPAVERPAPPRAARSPAILLDPAALEPLDATLPSLPPGTWRSALDDDAAYESAPLAALDLHGDGEGAEDAQRLLLHWLRRLPVGGALRLTLPVDSPALPTGDMIDDAVVLVIALGCRVEAARIEGEEVMVAATKLSDWRAALPGPDGERRFVRFLYRHALGREADRGGALNYLGELAAGRTREELLRAFLCSPERRDRIATLWRAATAR